MSIFSPRGTFRRATRMGSSLKTWLVGLALGLLGHSMALAQAGGQLPLLVGSGGSNLSFSVPVQTLLFFTALSFCRLFC